MATSSGSILNVPVSIPSECAAGYPVAKLTTFSRNQISMSQARIRYLTLLEAFFFAAFIGFYIWRLQWAHPDAWLVFPTWLTISFLIHGDTPKTMGWRADNLGEATRQGAIIFVLFVCAVCASGLFLGAFHRAPLHLTDRHRFIGYLAFCLLQQIALNSYLTNRFLSALNQPKLAAFLAGVVFAALHWPNPVLVPITFIGGIAMAWLFAKQRNILPLTLGQAILGGLIWWAFPLTWHHSMRVGPGYYTFGHIFW
jgi:Type II CAAX prenyl endopeptidase Rce1-like